MSDEQERDVDATPPMEIPHEQAIQQRPVPFMGDELAAAMTAGGNIYITLPGVCRALGLNTQAQFRRIVRTPSLAKHLRSIPLDTRGGVQQVNCLRVDKIALWLAGVETLKVKTEFRAKIEAYQDELAPVAMQVFLRVAGLGATQLVPATAPPEVAALAEQIDTLTGVVNLLREHLAGLLSLPGQVEGLSLQLQQAMSLLESLAER
jgi:antirepressor protein